MVKLNYERPIQANVNLQMESYYRQTDDHFIIDGRDTPLGFFLNAQRKEHHHGVKLILQLQRGDKNNQLALAYEYNYSTLDDFTQNIITATGDVFNNEGGGIGYERELHSLVADGRYYFSNEIWQLMYGARFDDYSDFGSQFTPRLGLLNHLSSDSVLKILYGRAFRAPSMLEILGGQGTQANANIKPEIIDSLELVWLYKQANWSSNVTLFTTQWQDGISLVSSSDPNFNFIYENEGENEAYGIELSGIREWNALRVDASASYVRSKNITSNSDYEGFPEYIANLGLGYKFLYYKIDVYLSNRLHLNAKEHSPTGNIPNPEKLAEYFRTDLVIDWQRSENMNLRTNFRNLLDRDNLYPSTESHENGLPDRGFNFSLELEYRM